MAGGMTYSEMRESYLLSKTLNKDIIIGESTTSQSEIYRLTFLRVNTCTYPWPVRGRSEGPRPRRHRLEGDPERARREQGPTAAARVL